MGRQQEAEQDMAALYEGFVTSVPMYAEDYEVGTFAESYLCD